MPLKIQRAIEEMKGSMDILAAK